MGRKHFLFPGGMKWRIVKQLISCLLWRCEGWPVGDTATCTTSLCDYFNISKTSSIWVQSNHHLRSTPLRHPPHNLWPLTQQAQHTHRCSHVRREQLWWEEELSWLTVCSLSPYMFWFSFSLRMTFVNMEINTKPVKASCLQTWDMFFLSSFCQTREKKNMSVSLLICLVCPWGHFRALLV